MYLLQQEHTEDGEVPINFGHNPSEPVVTFSQECQLN